ncbi:MAG: hypothetical protein O7E52_25525, partial [Candidatus Poribacteria bacterium]|nr:hypothetical protein [Candidatus Poribacteria bacterium]
MKRLMFCLGLLALFLSTRPQPVFASLFAEVGEAGNLPATAQTTVGVGMLTAIEGTVISRSDHDMFQIFIAEPANFSASTNNPGTILSIDDDTQLFLFDINGLGVLANDDDPDDIINFLPKAAIPLGEFSGSPGLYYIAISIFDNDPISGGGEIFPDEPFDAVVGPTGPGGASPITGWI